MNNHQTGTSSLSDEDFLLISKLLTGEVSIRNIPTEKFTNKNFILAISSSNNDFFRYATREMLSDRNFVLKAVANTLGNALQFIPDELLNDREFILQAVGVRGGSLRYLSKLEYFDDRDQVSPPRVIYDEDREIVKVAVLENAYSLQYASNSMRRNRELMIELIRETTDPRSLVEVSDAKMLDDEEFMGIAVERDGSILEFASPRIKSVKSIVKKAMSNYVYVFEDASEELRSDRELVMHALELGGGNLYEHFGEELKKDKNIILNVLSTNEDVFEHLDPEMRNDKDIVMCAVERDGNLLEHASDALRGDKQVVLRAVTTSAEALEYASDDLRSDLEVVQQAVSTNGCAIEYVLDESLKNRELLLKTISTYPQAIDGTEFSSDRDFILQCIRDQPIIMEYVDESLQTDKEFIKEIIKQSKGAAIEHLTEEMKSDQEIVMLSMEEYPAALQYASEEIKNNRDIVLKAVTVDGAVLDYCSEALKKDREVVMAAVGNNGQALSYASEVFRNDKEIALLACKTYGFAFLMVGESLRHDQDILEQAMETDPSTVVFIRKD
ncbi:predicted protein [Naegleria gruberi]|uniref:Predicted protein n=1 Tax=Naegleria gruberi TaxID=5762 RepID=D2VZF9_NAEGR|nr:uncharacterized protein NAEGRDRAFT_53487 [Naegleria gruberi]EFC37839.1 predicted protein [Naegleria gruberi]|eukprot:XP_002670583.1 predicted protein [Naegleria gruberi strain NEG-M]